MSSLRRLTSTAVMAVVLALAAQLASAEPMVRQTSPPIAGFFAKYLDCDGIPVRSSAAVEDRALQLACAKITTMLHDIPMVKDRLARRGSELHIIGRNEQTSDLPEFRSERGKVYIDNTGHAATIDERTRGKGGLLASCGEENLLQLASDRYRGGSDICIHEFSHTVMDYGFGPEQRELIAGQYARSLARGRWKSAYAATNAQEFWAELSMWYFGPHGDRRMAGPPPDDGRDGLRAYDAEAYALLRRLYTGNE
jgi:alpha-glucosidase